MNESSIFKNLTRDVRSIGGESFHADKLHTGFPDKIILLPGGVALFAELKTPTGTMRPGQLYWIDRLNKLGFAADVFRDYKSLIEWVKERKA